MAGEETRVEVQSCDSCEDGERPDHESLAHEYSKTPGDIAHSKAVAKGPQSDIVVKFSLANISPVALHLGLVEAGVNMGYCVSKFTMYFLKKSMRSSLAFCSSAV